MKRKRRFTFGMIVSAGFDAENYDSMLWPGAVEFAEKNDINLLLFVGRQNSGDEMSFNSDITHEFATAETVDGLIIPTGTMTDFLTPSQIRHFCRQFRPLPIVSIAMAIPGVPSVLVDNAYGIKEVIGHCIVEHNHRTIGFIQGPKYNQDAIERFNAYKKVLQAYKIPFDPDLVVEGNFTAESAKQAMKELFEKRKRRVDVVVASDDESAFGALAFLKSNGYKVPYDVAITGFDNVERASSVSPPLTTVRQPVWEQSNKACELLLAMVRGKKVPLRTCLPTKMVVRQSCGCFSDVIKQIKSVAISTGSHSWMHEEKIRDSATVIIQVIVNDLYNKFGDMKLDRKEITLHVQNLLVAILEDIFNKKKQDYFLWFFYNFLTDFVAEEKDISIWNYVLVHLQKQVLSFIEEKDIVFKTQNLFQKAEIIYDEILLLNKSYISLQKEQRMWLLLQISQSLIHSFDLENMKTVIARELPRLKIRRCFLSLFREPLLKGPEAEGRRVLPRHSELVLASTEKGRVHMAAPKNIFATQRLLPDELFPKVERFTYILMSVYFNEEQFGFILYEYGPAEDIIYETIRGQISSVIKGSVILKNLESKNLELKALSLNDQLTGLYNRRGFSLLGNQQMHVQRRNKKDLLFFFMDLDKLKQINDTYGHKEGDAALANMAEILKTTFRSEDIIARIGGDEFTVLTIDASSSCKDTIVKRLKKNLATFNAALKKPYRLSVSFGYSGLNWRENLTLEDLIDRADKMLYKNKAARKQHTLLASGPKAAAGTR
jgi:diguanylate cyclase (GGDEF)-like protein